MASSAKTHKHIAMAIIQNPEGQLLIARRACYDNEPDLWEFPGGKVEAGETALDAVVREVQEEVGVVLTAPTLLTEFFHEYPNKQLFFSVFLAKEFKGNPHGAEGQLIRWVDINELNNYRLPEANGKIEFTGL